MNLRRCACAIALLLTAASDALAQDPAAPSTDAAPASRPRIEYGVRFGPSFTSLTSVETFDPDAVAAAVEPTMNFGGFLTMGLGGPFSLQGEILFAAKGNRIHASDAPPVITGTGTKPPRADRVVLIRYLEVPLLIRLSSRTGEDSSVYLIGGPSFALRRNAVIRQVVDSGRLEEITDAVLGNNLLVVVGAGLQHRRWLLDARLSRGVRNVAAEASDVRTNAFSALMGVRF
jgi:hypothetical protein